ncbi:unnamed protein product [Closterium sp. Naga37s-1]|nr:unnamed protein product [Closterium sp. Naga37s-1]
MLAVAAQEGAEQQRGWKGGATAGSGREAAAAAEAGMSGYGSVTLARIQEAVACSLQIPPSLVAPDSDFFSLGASSLSLALVALRLGVTLPLLLAFPSPLRLMHALRGEGGGRGVLEGRGGREGFVKGRIEEGRVEEGGIEEARIEEGGIEEARIEEGGIEEARIEEGGIEEARIEEGRVEEGRIGKGRIEEGREVEGQREKGREVERRAEEGRIVEGRILEEREVEERGDWWGERREGRANGRGDVGRAEEAKGSAGGRGVKRKRKEIKGTMDVNAAVAVVDRDSTMLRDTGTGGEQSRAVAAAALVSVTRAGGVSVWDSGGVLVWGSEEGIVGLDRGFSAAAHVPATADTSAAVEAAAAAPAAAAPAAAAAAAATAAAATAAAATAAERPTVTASTTAPAGGAEIASNAGSGGSGGSGGSSRECMEVQWSMGTGACVDASPLLVCANGTWLCVIASHSATVLCCNLRCVLPYMLLMPFPPTSSQTSPIHAVPRPPFVAKFPVCFCLVIRPITPSQPHSQVPSLRSHSSPRSSPRPPHPPIAPHPPLPVACGHHAAARRSNAHPWLTHGALTSSGIPSAWCGSHDRHIYVLHAALRCCLWRRSLSPPAAFFASPVAHLPSRHVIISTTSPRGTVAACRSSPSSSSPSSPTASPTHPRAARTACGSSGGVGIGADSGMGRGSEGSGRSGWGGGVAAHGLAVVWQQAVGAPVFSTPACVREHVVVATVAGTVAGVNVSCGRIDWQVAVGAPVFAPVAHMGSARSAWPVQHVLVAVQNGAVLCMDGAAAAQPLITQQQVQEWVHEASGILGAIRRLGLPATSWRNKMPYRVPRAEPLARGLKWPEQHEFANEHEKRVFLRSQRRLQPFLLGDIPQWSWFAADVALLFFLTYEPRWPWALD